MKTTKIAVSAIICAIGFLPFISHGAVLNQAEQRGALAEAETRRVENQGDAAIQQASSSDATTTDENKGRNNKEGKDKKEKGQPNDRALERRSAVANAVQELLQVADRTGGIGQQIREVAKAQDDNNKEVEDKIKTIKNRGRLLKFFFGPDYKNLKTTEEKLSYQDKKLSELKQLATQVTDEKDAAKVQEQIKAIENINSELKEQVINESKGFSLFGWFNKMMSK